MQLMMMVIRDRRNAIRARARTELELEMIELEETFVLSIAFWLVEVTMDSDSNLG